MASAWTYDVGDYREALDQACDRIEALEARLAAAEAVCEAAVTVDSEDRADSLPMRPRERVLHDVLEAWRLAKGGEK
jgi:hypothetical protein